VAQIAYGKNVKRGAAQAKAGLRTSPAPVTISWR
jgi:hypothetical protein